MIDTALAALKQDKFVLLSAATGAGKTLVFSGLVKQLITSYPLMRIAILAHRLELVQQAKDKLLKVWFDAPIGIACASAKDKMDTDMPITIGSIQTLSNHAQTTAPFHLIIIDEVHIVPPANVESQYQQWLSAMQTYNPDVRVLGFTATPFRLGHGHIYGEKCKEGNVNWFNELNYRIGIRDLQKQGYLCGYRAKAIVDIGNNLDRIKTTGGEFNLGDLSDLMSNITHVGSAVKAFQEYGENRKHVVVFAVTIEHGETLNGAFREAGYTSTIVHSKMPMAQRNMALESFETGATQIIVNVGILTTGWDSPATDCIMMCRPTKSPALFVQMTGRGLRICEGKKDVLILDLANNCKTHGDPADPIVEIPKSNESKQKPPQKHCPKCKEMMHAAATECPACGHIFEVEQKEAFNGNVKMRTVDFKAKPKELPFTFHISDGGMEIYNSKKGNRMIKMWLQDKSFIPPKYVNVFWQFDDDAHEFARKKARMDWFTITGNRPPETTDEAYKREGEIQMNLPESIEVVPDGDFIKVKNWRPTVDIPKPQQKHEQLIEEEIPF